VRSSDPGVFARSRRPVRAGSSAAEDDLHRRRRGHGVSPINPDKTADYEKVIATLKDTLSKSEAPEAKQQLAGWK
jgi:hypothetical protein